MKTTANFPNSDSNHVPGKLENHSDEDLPETTERDLTVEVDETDDEQEVSNNYQLLPTSSDQEIEFGYSTFDGEDIQVSVSNDYHNLLQEQDVPQKISCSSEGKFVVDDTSLPLDSTKVETIKNIMSNIRIPPTSIPVWAHTVSDDQLKKVVEDKIVKNSDENWAVFD